MTDDRSYKTTAVCLLEHILNELVGDEPVKVHVHLGPTGRKLFEKKILRQTKLSDYFNLTTEEPVPFTDTFIYYTFHKKYMLKDLSGLIKALKIDLEDELFNLVR